MTWKVEAVSCLSIRFVLRVVKSLRMASSGDSLLCTRRFKYAFWLKRWLSRISRTLSSFYRSHCGPIFSKFNGYHFGVLCCAWTSGAVFLLNLITTGWAVAHSGTFTGLGTSHEGSCKQSSKLGFWIHLMINVLSTTLLGASNYAMQCLNAPTRTEIDKAHAKGDWLDIGIISMRNIRKTAYHRQALWWALATSTIPLHLLWNSAVFISLSSHDYVAWVVPSDFALFNTTITTDPNGLGYFTGLTDNLPFHTINHPYVSPLPGSFNDSMASSSGSVKRSYNDTMSRGSILKSSTDSNPNNNGIMPPINKTTNRGNISTDSLLGTYSNILPTSLGIPENTSSIYYSRFYNYPAWVTPGYSDFWDSHNLSVRDVISAFQTNSSKFDRLDAHACQNQYQGPIVSRRKNVLLVSSIKSNNSSFWEQHAGLPQSFMLGLGMYMSNYPLCSATNNSINPFACTYQGRNSESGNHFFDYYGIHSCVSQPAEEDCKLQFSPAIMTVVVICNFIKVLCFTYIAWRQDPAPLITIGDTIASFLQREDVSTKRMCLVNDQVFRRPKLKRFQPLEPTDACWPSDEGFRAFRPFVWKPAHQRRFASVDKRTWIRILSL